MFVTMKKEQLKEIFRFVPKELLERTFVVGGFVRDYVMNKESNDIDYVVVGSFHEEMIKLGFEQVGADFPVYLDKFGNEFALCRKDIKSGKGFLGFKTITKDITLEEDLLRRDLNCNAMAINYKGELFDPFNGLVDIENKTLRHVSVAFAEDPVRVLRLARFSARFPDFSIDNETKVLVLSLREELKDLNKERMFKELEKSLVLDHASKYFKTLLELEVLDILFPELYAMTKHDQTSEFHAEGNVFLHTMRVLEQACLKSKSFKVRFGALYHDIGKPDCADEYGSFNGHSSTDIVEPLFLVLKNRLRVPTKIIEFAILVAKSHHKFHGLETIGDKGIERLIFDRIFPKTHEELEDLVIAITADSCGRITSERGLSRTLTIEESNEVFENGLGVFDNIIYLQGEKDLNTEYLRFLFEIKFLKSKVQSFISTSEIKPSVNSIKQFVHKEKLNRIQSVQKIFIT